MCRRYVVLAALVGEVTPHHCVGGIQQHHDRAEDGQMAGAVPNCPAYFLRGRGAREHEEQEHTENVLDEPTGGYSHDFRLSQDGVIRQDCDTKLQSVTASDYSSAAHLHRQRQAQRQRTHSRRNAQSCTLHVAQCAPTASAEQRLANGRFLPASNANEGTSQMITACTNHTRATRAALVILMIGGGVVAPDSPLMAQAGSARDSATTSSSDTTAGHHHAFRIGLALGPGIAWQHLSDGVTGHEIAPALTGGLFRGSKLGPADRTAFVPAFKVSIWPSQVAAVSAANPTGASLQTLKLRPMMLGVAWSAPLASRLTGRIEALAGQSFNSIGAADSARTIPRLAVVAPPSDITNSFAWETSANLWFNVIPKVTLVAGASFLHSRPELRFADGSARAWNADQVRLEAGVAFTLFQWER